MQGGKCMGDGEGCMDGRWVRMGGSYRRDAVMKHEDMGEGVRKVRRRRRRRPVEVLVWWGGYQELWEGAGGCVEGPGIGCRLLYTIMVNTDAGGLLLHPCLFYCFFFLVLYLVFLSLYESYLLVSKFLYAYSFIHILIYICNYLTPG